MAMEMEMETERGTDMPHWQCYHNNNNNSKSRQAVGEREHEDCLAEPISLARDQPRRLTFAIFDI